MATKQLRYLESADLNIDLIKIYPKNYGLIGKPQLPYFDKIINSLTHKVSIEKIDQAFTKEIDQNIAELDIKYQTDARIIYEVIEASNVIGLSEEELIV